jgi:hypothetical protein
MTEGQVGTDAGRMLSHGDGGETLERAVQATRGRIRQAAGDKTHVTVARQLELVDQLLEFPLGRFLLQNRGLNGFWTDYIIEHPGHGRMTGRDPEGRPLTTLERILLDEFPTVQATQQRALCFERLIQQNVKDGAVLASVPCGLMRDLLGRDFSDVSEIRLIGIDIDGESLAGAKRLAEFYGIGGNVEFREADAWDLRLDQRLTLLASNGLNIYERCDDKVTALYRQFFGALAPGGVLVTSFLTPPPVLDPQSK